MRILLPILVSLLALAAADAAWAKEKRYKEVTVADPYLDMRTGPGRGYPIFNTVGRGDTVQIKQRRTVWFQVLDDRGREGWVHRDQLEQTLLPSGENLDVGDPTLDDLSTRRWELGMMGGDFEGANVLSVYGAYGLTPHLSTEVWVSQALGNFSNSYMANVNIVHQFFPEWRATPFFTLGTGVIHTEPKATLVQAEDRTDEVAHVGAGVRAYLSRRFVFRAEYKSYVVFTSRDDNEEIEEWKVGFAFFF